MQYFVMWIYGNLFNPYLICVIEFLGIFCYFNNPVKNGLACMLCFFILFPFKTTWFPLVIFLIELYFLHLLCWYHAVWTLKGILCIFGSFIQKFYI
jgi:hypothetical protein